MVLGGDCSSGVAAAVSARGLHDPEAGDNPQEANLRKSIRLLAKSPLAVAYGHHLAAGQNPVEAVFAEKPVSLGPNMQNFASLTYDLIAKGGVIQAEDEVELVERISELLENPEIGVTLSQNANLALSLHKGAADRTAELIINW